jgi:adenosine kinase
MRIAVTGSIALDHLMIFRGRFAEQLVSGHLDHLSLSFLVDRLDVRYGGVAANISAGLGRLGYRPVLVGAVGSDFADYRAWLIEQGVDTDSVLVVPDEHTARFLCTTDESQNQIASFYPGAMRAASQIELNRVFDRIGDCLVVIGANDPDAMLRHTAECFNSGLRFAADPSQQLALLEGESIRTLVTGADFLFTNEYERALLLQKTGWTEQDVLSRVGSWVTTLGAAGVRVDNARRRSFTVQAVPPADIVDPAGAGDGFRAGYLAGVGWGLAPVLAAQLGCAVATLVLEEKGTAEYRLDRADVLHRIAATYGKESAATLGPQLAGSRQHGLSDLAAGAVRP